MDINALTKIPACTNAPPLRCYFPYRNSPLISCGELAVWARPGRFYWLTEFFCERHHEPSDVPIAAIHAFRRVHISVDVYFAGASTELSISQTEAVARLEEIIHRAGGLVDVHRVSSQIVKNLVPSCPVGAGNGRGSLG